MEKIIEKLRKIKLLVERGCAGEAQAAKAILERLLKQYGLTVKDLSDTVRKERCFTAKTDNDLAVLIMCCMHVAGRNSADGMYNYKGKPGKLHIELTDYEFAEISGLFDFHRRNMKKEFERLREEFKMSYMHRHKLYSSDPKPESGEREMDPEKLARIVRMAAEMQNVQYFKAIGENSETN